ncbi:transcriptional regulator NrdR [Bombilactobacillus thymidiniphilus]|uniref:Transcriptional repressor NrdR n=1 Tax=Bombilactobacillus thymidiniphilus TaxID=2923363 RepID=A0ABY4PCH2_9LACO|nr:transcriptional regulator NrdR [Bombilactobacillus thymidiniphilus]UQS83354.1 transcriptional regulator NrdR [Bombilactobacillus thymidiniphilus]
MICPHCQQNSSRVVDSRPSDEGKVIRRRRECENCGYRFTTFERVEQPPLLVIKRNGNREEFKREKILQGLIKAAEKRSISLTTMNQLVNTVEANIRSLDENEIESRQIGEYVMQQLATLDDVTYIRFASVYRQFTDINGFMKEVKEMMVSQNDLQNIESKRAKKYNDEAEND